MRRAVVCVAALTMVVSALHEGFAAWTEWISDEHTGAATAHESFLDAYSIPAGSSFWTRPPAVLGSPVFLFSNPPYLRGAMTLQALREKIGDTAFFGLMRGWTTRNRYGNVTSAEFVAAAEQQSGMDLDAFFDVWLYQPGEADDLVTSRVIEAPLRGTEYGLVADVDGWFVVNAREARWRESDAFGTWCDFEGKRPFRQLGINISILEPGQSLGCYHREAAQEDFLVLVGTCLLIVEEEERKLEAWDFVHCPAETDHMIVGTGDGPAVVLAVGARGLSRKGLVYVPSKVARAHGASVDKETTKPTEAYADLPRSRRVAHNEGWLPDY